MAVEVQADFTYMDLTSSTQCTSCVNNNNSDWSNSTTWSNGTTWSNESYIGYRLHEIQIIAELNPLLLEVPKYVYLVWYFIGLPANFIAFAVWIQRQVGLHIS